MKNSKNRFGCHQLMAEEGGIWQNSKSSELEIPRGSPRSKTSDVYLAWLPTRKGLAMPRSTISVLILANRGLTLKDDRTPEYWRASGEGEDCHSLGDDDTAKGLPFTILIGDSAEQEPFHIPGPDRQRRQSR